ncbi:MAG: SGNH/GDSL hydrolase family protein [Prevotella sp.]|jgi:lysophospholipase L1-like esterase|nr:SGNH/GDSL hydrolase family protein [Prevotella sp.]
MKRIVIGISLLCVFSFFLQAQQITPFKYGDRVVFLGNSITDGGHYHSYIWLYYMTRFPDIPIKILNAGIGGDRAVDMYNRLDGDVFSKNPTVLITTFGMNDSGYFEYNGDEPEKFADEKVKESYEAYKKIEERYKALSGTKLVLMGSSPYDETAKIENNEPLRNKNKAMLRIVDFQRKSAEENGWEFLDLNVPMTEINQRVQQHNSAFALCGNDRIHPDNDGHMVMAYLFLKAQGFVGNEVASVEVDAQKKSIDYTSNCSVSDLKVTPSTIQFDYLANALPYPLDTIARGWGSRKSQVLGAEVVPFIVEMNKEIFKVKGLKGEYKLIIDEEEIGIWKANELEEGINLATQTKTPQYQQALAVMYLNESRWEIERRFREYAWIQFNFFKPRGLLFANNRKAIEAVDAHKAKDGWLNANRDSYSKMIYSEVRKALENQMEMLIHTIYDINQPVARRVTLIKQ